MELVRAVRFGGRVYLPGNKVHEVDLQRDLPKKDLLRLAAKGYLKVDVKSGSTPQAEANAASAPKAPKRVRKPAKQKATKQ